jgi:hypothetical protein
MQITLYPFAQKRMFEIKEKEKKDWRDWTDNRLMLNTGYYLTLCSFDSSLHCNEYSYMSLLPRSDHVKTGIGVKL